MAAVTETIEVGVAPADAFAAWVRFAGLDGGDAEVTEHRPGERVAWRAAAGQPPAGTATFEPAGERSTRLTVEADAAHEEEEPDLPGRRLRADLERFAASVAGSATTSGEPGHGPGRYSRPGSAGAPLSDEPAGAGTPGDAPGRADEPGYGGPNPAPRREQPGL